MTPAAHNQAHDTRCNITVWQLSDPASAICPKCKVVCTVYCSTRSHSTRLQYRRCPICSHRVKTSITEES